MSYDLYFTLGFLGIISFAMLIGFLRGFRNSLYSFLVKLAFFAIFFLTLNLVVNSLWTMTLPGIAGVVSAIVPGTTNVHSLDEALPIVLAELLGGSLGDTATHPELLAFISGIGIFIVKIVYTIVYFTGIYIIWRLIFFIFRIIVFSKSEKTMKTRAMGAGVGALNGVLSIFVMLIVFGGIMSIAESFASLASDSEITAEYIEFETLNDGGTQVAVGDLDGTVEMLQDIVNGFNNNPFVSAANAIKITGDSDVSRAAHIYLFDSVFSFNYREKEISIRKEIEIVAEIGGIIYQSEFTEDNNIAAVKPDEVRDVFSSLSRSDLFTSLLPLGIELGAAYSEIDLDELLEDHEIDLYEIDWAKEVEQLGAVVYVLVDIIHTAGLVDEETELETVTFDAYKVSEFFNEMSESELITLSAYVAMNPLLEQMGSDAQAIITVPEDMDWKEEFQAMGDIVSEIVRTGVTIGDFQDGDPMNLLTVMNTFDFVVMLESRLLSHAMVNILEGRADIDGLDIIVVPVGLDWFDKEDGELLKIFRGFNEIAEVASTISFEDDFDLNFIQELSIQSINTLIASEVLEATIGNLIIDEIGDVLTIPLSAQKEITTIKGDVIQIVLGTEISKIFDAISVFAIDDFNNLEFGMSLLQSLAIDDDENRYILNEAKAAKLFGEDASQIIHATLSTMLFDLMDDAEGNDVLVVPYKNAGDEPIQYIEDDIRYIESDEIINVLRAVLLLGIDDFEDIESLDIDRLIDHAEVILQAAILHATLSNQLFDFMDDGEDSFIVVPHLDAEGEPIRLLVGEGEVFTWNSESMEFTYIELEEITALLDALKYLELTDFDAIADDFDLDLSLLVEEDDSITPILDSAIIHASVSKQILDLDESDDPDGTLVVPYYKAPENGDPATLIRVNVGSGDTLTTYIVKEEIQALLNAFDLIMDEGSIDDFDPDFDISILVEEEGVTPVLKSAIIHATISRQIFKLDESDDPDGTIVVPYYKAPENGDPAELIRLSVGFGETDPDNNDASMHTNFLVKDEIQALINAFDVIMEGGSIDDFDTDFDISILVEEEGVTSVLSSAVIHATISRQIFKLDESDDPEGTIVVPYYKAPENGDPAELIRLSVGFGETDSDNDDAPMHTNFIIKEEIQALINAFDVIMEDGGIDDFDTDFDISILVEEEGDITSVLNSAVIHATISRQIFNLDESDDPEGTIIVPHIKLLEDNSSEDIRFVLGFGETDSDNNDVSMATTFISKSEIQAVINALDLIMEGGTLDSFEGDFDISLLVEEGDDITSVLSSAIIHATISRQLLNLDQSDDPNGLIVIPYYDAADISDPKAIRFRVGFNETDVFGNDKETVYITKAEIQAAINAFDVIFDGSFSEFTGDIALSTIYDPDEEVNEIEKLLKSAIIHATFSKQIIDLDDWDDLGQTSTNATVIVPFYKQPENGNPADQIRVLIMEAQNDADTGESLETEYIVKSEIEDIIHALHIIMDEEDDSLTAFTGDVDLSKLLEDNNAEEVLQSAVIQATVSNQVLKIEDDGNVIVPFLSGDSNEKQIRISVSHATVNFEYIERTELVNLIDALNILGDNDITEFGGSISLSLIYAPDSDPALDVDERDTMLASAIIHATLSDQLFGVENDGNLVIPVTIERNHNTIDAFVEEVRLETNSDGNLNQFITQIEIKRLIEVIHLFGIDDVSEFDGEFNLEVLDGDGQDILLASASMHATISKTLYDLHEDAAIVLPFISQHGSRTVRFDFDSIDYVTEFEIRKLIDAFIVMEYTDLSSFGDEPLDSTKFFDERDVILLSDVIHATLSREMLDASQSGMLIIRDYYDDLGDLNDVTNQIRITTTGDIIYVDRDEVDGVMEALEILGLTDFNNIVITPGVIFAEGVDFEDLINASVTMQATISKTFLEDAGALDDAALDPLVASSPQLVVPNDFRQDILVTIFNNVTEDYEQVPRKQIEKDELINMLTGIQILVNADENYEDFGDDFSAEAITQLEDDDIETMLESASIHVTIHNMLRGNANIDIPDRATESLYEIQEAEIITAIEVQKFIKSVFTLGETSFTDANFDFQTIAGLDEEDREIILDSLIVQNTLTPAVNNAITVYQASIFPNTYTVPNSYYHDDDPGTFFTGEGINNVIKEIDEDVTD